MDQQEIPDFFFEKCPNDPEETMDLAIYPFKNFFFSYPTVNIPRHCVHFYEIIFFTKGEGEQQIDLQKYPFQVGSIFFIGKGQTLSYDLQGQDGWILYFPMTFLEKHIQPSDQFIMEKLYNTHLNAPQLRAEGEAFSTISTLFQDLFKEFRGPKDSMRESLIYSLLRQLFIRVERLCCPEIHSNCQNPHFGIFADFQKKIEAHHKETRNAVDYAAMLSISVRKLSYICKSYTSLTPKQFIDSWIMQELKRSIIASNQSINEISENIGFDEPTNMVKYFKQRTGLTPVQFRNKNRVLSS